MKKFLKRLKGTKDFQSYYEKNSPRGKEEFMDRRKLEKEENKKEQEFLKEKQLEAKEKFNKSKLSKTFIGQKVKSTKNVSFKRVQAPKPQIAPMYSKEQRFMRTFFGHGDKVIFNNPNSQSLPVINGSLMPYSFGDETESGTAETFGLGSIKRRTGLY